jgi:hypothetical protein
MLSVFICYELDRDIGGFRFNRTACCLCCKFYDSDAVLHNTILPSPLHSSCVTLPLPLYHTNTVVKMTHTLATSLLNFWASSATPDLKITEQKKTCLFQRC